MKNLNKATSYCILKSKDTKFNFSIFLALFIFLTFALFKGFLGTKSEEEIMLVLYILILGMTLIMANSMIVDLTVKDKLKGRIEFFLGSAIQFEDILSSYSLQMLRISSIIPFFIFMIFYYLFDFSYSFLLVVLMYLTTVFLAYTEIYFLNVFSLTAKKNKLFKNIVFFASFLLIYLLGMFSKEIVGFFNGLGIDLLYFILGLNIILSLVLFIFARRKFKSLNNEKIIQGRGEWK